jgi:hypothetical protein
MSLPDGRHPLSIAAALTLIAATAGQAQRPGPPGAAFTQGTPPSVIADVVIHPIVAQAFTCSEHSLDLTGGGVIILGDAIGADCTVTRYDLQPAGRRPPRYFENDGLKNEDWFGWNEPLLAPFDGVVEEIHINPVTNTPGTPGRGPSSFIVFLRSDSTRVAYGHIQDVKVKQGEKVTAGQPVATVGNNGYGYMPHTHIGAWRGAQPLQLRFDLKALGVLEAARYAAQRSPGN